MLIEDVGPAISVFVEDIWIGWAQNGIGRYKRKIEGTNQRQNRT